jgi:hypothetical protein
MAAESMLVVVFAEQDVPQDSRNTWLWNNNVALIADDV